MTGWSEISLPCSTPIVLTFSIEIVNTLVWRKSHSHTTKDCTTSSTPVDHQARVLSGAGDMQFFRSVSAETMLASIAVSAGSAWSLAAIFGMNDSAIQDASHFQVDGIRMAEMTT